MKRFLLLILFLYSLSPTAQEVYPLQPIERTSFYAEPLDEPIDTELPSGSITARESGANTIGLTTGELSVSVVVQQSIQYLLPYLKVLEE